MGAVRPAIGWLAIKLEILVLNELCGWRENTVYSTD